MTTFVVVGGDAAGMSAASKAKREDSDLEVVVFEKGQWVSYGACGLPYYIKGEIQSLEDLVSVTPEEFREERDIDLRTGHEIVAIDPDENTVTAEHDGSKTVQSYDQLLIATGSESVVPPIDGTALEESTLGSMSDGRNSASTSREHETGHAPAARQGPACRYLEDCAGPVGIVGGGYIGVEMAEALAANGFEVNLFQRGDRVLKGSAMRRVTQLRTIFESRTSWYTSEPTCRRFRVTNASKPSSPTTSRSTSRWSCSEPAFDHERRSPRTLASNSVRPVQSRRIRIGRRAFPTYAAGDCAESTHVVTGEPAYVPLALTANRHGRAIGQTVTGRPTEGEDSWHGGRQSVRHRGSTDRDARPRGSSGRLRSGERNCHGEIPRRLLSGRRDGYDHADRRS